MDSWRRRLAPDALTSACADRHAQRLRAEIDAIALCSERFSPTIRSLAPRGVYRASADAVVFDRELRTPPGARILSTLEAGPVIIVTTAPFAPACGAQRARGAGRGSRSRQIARCGRRCNASASATSARCCSRAAPPCSVPRQEDVVDFVRLYVTPHVLGVGGVPFLDGCRFSTTTLAERRVVPLGPDVLIEGYVHGLMRRSEKSRRARPRPAVNGFRFARLWRTC